MAAGFVDARSDLATTKRLSQALWQAKPDFRLTGEGRVRTKVLATSDGGMVFISRMLDAVDEDRDYQLWLMRGACAEVAAPACKKISAGTFEVTDGVAIVRSEMSLDGVKRAAVTIEPEGGSPQPTTDPVLLST
jgi:anti-sigma-K factor RskA